MLDILVLWKVPAMHLSPPETRVEQSSRASSPSQASLLWKSYTRPLEQDFQGMLDLLHLWKVPSAHPSLVRHALNSLLKKFLAVLGPLVENFRKC